MRLENKIVVVTGAAQGIGRAAAERFAQEGARSVVVDLNRELGQAAADAIVEGGGKAHFVAADVSKKADVNALVAEVTAQFRRIDVLMNNAAKTNVTPFLEVTEDEFDNTIATNLKSVFLCGQAVARDMIERGISGAIINMSSITALLATPTQAAYGASKGGINSLTKVMAVALAEHGIRVNAIGPGTILTDLAREVVLSDETSRRRTMSRIPLRRCGEPEEVASIAAFLASDEASYITGQTIYPDGGRLSLNYTVPVDD